ncbi:uncharacterized protein LOC144918848 [Branchiostoma floridae x Branchiostoma belcheri]
MWLKALLFALMVSVAVCGANSHFNMGSGTSGGSANEVSPNRSPFLTEREAKSFIKRSRKARAANGNEVIPHDLHHECVDEGCDYHEVYEVFENIFQSDRWLWKKACQIYPCLPEPIEYCRPRQRGDRINLRKGNFGPQWRICIKPKVTGGRIVYNCTDCDLDLMFLVDGSSSVGEDGFQHAQQYMVNAIEDLSCSNVGMIYCKCESNISISLGKFDDVFDLQDAVGDVDFTPSTTRVGYCIKHMQCTTPWRDGVPRVVVVLSDGRIYGTYDGKHTEDVGAMAQAARDAGITLYAGAAGRSVLFDQSGLETIAGSIDRVFSAIDEDPSWLLTIISVEQCGSCSALADAIRWKVPYPWEDDEGPNEGQCIFEPRQLQQVCNALTTSDCATELQLYHQAFWDSISALLDYTTDHLTSILHDVDTRVEELLGRLEETIANSDVTVRETTETAISEVRNAVSNIIDASTNIIPDLADIVDGVLENIQDLICSLIDKAGQLYGVVQDYFYNLIKDTFEPFRDFVNDVYNSLESTVTGLLSSLPYYIESELEQILEEVNYIRLFMYFDWVFGGGLDSLICRFLWWLIRPNRMPFTYPVPYEIPGIPPLPPLPTPPPY